MFKSAHKRSPSSDHEKINFYGRIAIFMKLGAHYPNRRKTVTELRSWENQFLRPNRNFHEIGCWLPKSAHKRSPSSDHEKINFYGRIAIFIKLGAHCPNRRPSGPGAQIMRKSIFTAESQFSWNWVLTAQTGAQAVPELRSWENQFLRPNRNFHEIGCWLPKSAHKRSPSSDHEKINFYGRIEFHEIGCSLFKSVHKRSRSSDHEKINFYGRIAIFMKLGAHCSNRRTSGPRAQIMRKSIFTAESQFSWNWVLTAQIGAQAVPELRSWENQFLRPNRNFHEIGSSLFKSAHKRSRSSDHEKINFYGRIAILMKLGAHCSNRRTSGPRAHIMRKSIFTAESQFSWNWVLTAQIGAQTVPELRSWENQFLRPNRNFHEIGCSLPKSAHKRSPSSDHEKINFYGRIAIFMKLGAKCSNRRTSGPRAQIMRKSIFTAESQFSWNWVLTTQIGAKRSPSSGHEKINFYGRIAIFMKLGADCPNRRTSGPRAQIMRKSIFTAESQFSLNWVLTAQIGAQAVPELRSWENQFLRPNRNFHEIGCSLPKPAHKRSPSSDHEKINFYGRIAIFMKLGAHCPNRRTSGPRAQVMRKSIFTAESQFSWNWVLTAQIGAQAVHELRSWENQFLRLNRNFHEIGCWLPKSAHKRSPSSDHEKINFYGRIAIFMKLGAHCPNRRTSGPRAQVMRKSIFTAESQFSWNWVLTAQIGAQAVPELRSWENQFLRPNRNFHEIGCSLPKSAHKRSPSSDHEKINFYGRIAIFMKLGAKCSNRRTSGPRAQIMRKSIFTAESQFSWNWVLTTQIGAKAVHELRSWENQCLRPNRNFHEIGCWLPKSAHKRSPSSDHEKINFYGRIEFHEIGCSLLKSVHKRSPSSDHEKINFYGRIAIFMKLGAHCSNRRTSGPRAQIIRKSIFTAESQFSWNWVLTAQIGAQAVPELRSWENQFLRPNRNFHEIGCSLFKSAHKRSRSSDHEKINFYGRIAIFMKLGAHCPNRRTSGPGAQIMRKSIFTAELQFSWNWVLTAQIGAKAVHELRSWENQFLLPNRNFHEIGCWLPKSAHKRSPSSDHEKINFYGRIAIFMKLGAHYPNRCTSGPRAQIMRKSIFTAESQFSWNWVLTVQIGAQAVPELRSWENQFLRPNRNFHEIGCSLPKSAPKRSRSSDHEKINFYGRIAIFMKLGAHCSNRRTSGPRAQIMRKSIFTAESQFSWNWVLTVQIGAQAVPELRSWENQFLRPNRNFHEIGCSLPKSAHKAVPSSGHEKINFYGRIAIFMKLGAHWPNRRTSGPRAQIMRKSIFTAESQFSWNWVLTAQIGAQAVPELRSWENQFLRPNRNFHEIGCSLFKSAHKRSPSSDHEKINFYGRIAIFMKLGAHCPNRRTSGPRAQIMRKSIFTAESQFSWNWVLTAQIGAQAVPELRSWENQFLRPNRNFHEIGCSLPKSAHKRSPSSDHEKINFYGRIAIFMKLGAKCSNRRTSGPRAQIMRKSIFTAESQFSWNWVLTTQIGAKAVHELRSWENQFLRPNRNFHEIGCWLPKSAHKRSPSSDHEKINFYGRIEFHEIGCSLLKSVHKRSPSSDHEKINFYGRIAIFMKLGAHCSNRRTSGPRAQIMRKSIFTAESQFSWNWVLTAQIGAQAVPELRSWENQFLRPNRNFHEIGCSLFKSAHKRSPSSDHEKINFYGRIAIFMKLGAHCSNRRTSGPRAQIMRKSIFTAESQFSWNWVLTAQIGAQAVPELRSWENQFLRPNRNFHEIGCWLPKSAHKRSPSSDHEKINFYGRIAIFMKLGAHYPNRRTSGPRAQIMRKSIFTAESQFSWNWVLTVQIGAQAVPELRSWENQFLRPNRNFHEIGCSLPKSAHKRSRSSDHEKINFYGRIAIFMKLGAHCSNRRTSGPRAQIMRKSIFTAESQFSWNWVLTVQIGAQAVPELRSWENQFLRPNRNFHEIGCSLPKSAHKRSPSSDHEKINFYGRIAIFMKLGAHCPNRRTSGPRAQIMRKSIFTAESQFSWNWVLTAQIGAQAVPELRSWENQFLRPNRNFHEIGCSLFKSAHKRSPSSDHEKINFYGRIAIFMKLGAHCPNRRTSGPRAQIMRKSIFTAESQFSWNWVLTVQIGAQAVPSSDHEKINFYGRIAIFMKLGAHCSNRRTSGPRAQIMRKSIFTAESQFSWNWVLTAQIGAQAVPELRSWENQFLRPNRNFHEIGCSLPKSAHKRSPSSDHEKINFYGRIAIFMKLGAHCPNRRTSGPRAQIMRKSIFTAESQFSWNWVLTAQIGAQAVPELRSWENQFLRPNRNFHEIGCSLPNRRTSGPRAQIMRKSIFTAESQFSWNWVLTAQIGAQAVPELRSWENQFLRPNRNFHEIGCSLPKSAHKRSPSSDHEKINFYGRIAIFMKLGAHCPNRRTSGPRAQIMRKSIFTAESQF